MAKKAAAGKTSAETTEGVTVELRRDMSVGGKVYPRGTTVGVVQVEAPFCLNYLVDAVRDGFAGERQPVEDEPEADPKTEEGGNAE